MKKIESRAYNSDSTEEEIKMLRDRVSLLDEATIHFNEVPVMSNFEIEITSNEIGKLLETSNACNLVINLTGVTPPNSPLRDQLKNCYSELVNKIDHVAFYTGKNAILNLIAKYMVRTVGYKNYSFHKTKDQAISAVKNG